ncbi:MAG: hypothetical protein U1D69_01995 [Polynucleobacter sp.]|uniref:hypothetical protein n=1 Tax=Limnobacter sp. TaxID=2003368 RepID=UPI002736FCAA|nr:hypothetical protein [Limnobacter sp.]MDP3272010.1 hypothetical protein [Limnobacter sp.]MDZ4055729.1 hypothetical protein [Polynucleobacter sp.]
MKYWRIIAVCLIGSIVSGCGIKILGLKQDGSRECPTGEKVYLYRDSNVGICLKEEVVIFTHCVSELSLSKSDRDVTNSFKTDLSGLKDILTSANFTPEFKTKVVREFASGGVLEEARAEAVRGCMQLAGMQRPGN